MNLFALISSFFERANRGRTEAPGWRNVGYRPRHRRGRRTHTQQPLRMTIEEFEDKEKRDDRFRALREKKTRDVSKFSTVRETGTIENGRKIYKNVWCVVRP